MEKVQFKWHYHVRLVAPLVLILRIREIPSQMLIDWLILGAEIIIVRNWKYDVKLDKIPYYRNYTAINQLMILPECMHEQLKKSTQRNSNQYVNEKWNK